jgi:two-component system sensor histidine kinase KdpD
VVSAAVVSATVATVAGLPVHDSQGSTVSLYLLAVVTASVAGGVPAGIGAALLSAAGFSVIFTEPRFRFRIDRPEDVVATLVFLAVAVIVGSLVGRTLDERERASRGERDARLLGYLSTKLLSGESIEQVLNDFADALLEPFGLDRCELQASIDGVDVTASAGRPDVDLGPREQIPLTLGGVSLGTLTAVRPAGGRPIDPQERALLEASARQAAVALERARMDSSVRRAQLDAEANQLRAALFSSVTHDLRTPLASIKASVTSLLDRAVTHDPLQERELLTTVLEETDRLNRLVGNIMDLAKIRAGALVPQRELVALDEIVNAVLARMRLDLGGIATRTVIRPDVPEISADPVQLDQVFTNLIENAARHSRDGGEIQVTAAVFGAGVQIRVVDHGAGIPAKERSKVFEPFYRGEGPPDRPGSGLGLPIARAIVIAHGGRIWIEGAPGGGTAVVFELPISLERT